jgi:hypothetical protein
MKMAQVRERLLEIAVETGNPEIVELVGHTYRRKPVNRAPTKSTKVDAALSARIADYSRRHPNKSQVEVGRIFNVNPGRVSEAVAGFRE